MGNQDKKKVQKYMAIYMSIGMCFGVSGGLIFGMILYPDNRTLGMCFGIPINFITIRYSFLVGIALSGTYVFYGYGISRTSLSNAGFICALPVVFTPVFAFLINRTRPSRKLIACLFLCSLGLALLTLNDSLRPALGDIICLGVPICYAFDLLLTEKAVQHSEVDALGLGVCQLGVVGIDH